MFLLHFLVNFITLAGEVFRLLNYSIILRILILLDSELGTDFFLFLKEEILGVRFRIQLCFKTKPGIS